MKEEIGAGINTGIIRAMGGTGKVVTNAGLVFAFTMAAAGISDLTSFKIRNGLMLASLLAYAALAPICGLAVHEIYASMVAQTRDTYAGKLGSTAEVT